MCAQKNASAMQLISRGSMYATTMRTTFNNSDGDARHRLSGSAPKSSEYRTKHAEHRIDIYKSIEMKRTEMRGKKRHSTAAVAVVVPATTNDRKIKFVVFAKRIRKFRTQEYC